MPRTVSLSGEHAGGFFNGRVQRCDVVLGIVEGERGTNRTRDTKAGHEWLAAVVAGADSDAHLIDQHADIVVVGGSDLERE